MFGATTRLLHTVIVGERSTRESQVTTLSTAEILDP